MYLIDTNVMSELVRSRPDPGVVAWADANMGDAGLATISIFELRLGIAQLPQGRRRDALMLTIERAINRLGSRIYAFDRAAAEAAGDLSGLSSGFGRPMPRMDAQIAGIASVYGLTIVTRNISDFSGTGLDLHNPWTAS